MVINYNIFINEGVKDLMKGKSFDEISRKMTKLSPEDMLVKSCEIGYLDGVKLALERGADPTCYYNRAIVLSSIYGFTEIVEFLLQDPRIKPTAQFNYAINGASQRGHTEIVRLLLQDERVNPSGNANDALRTASDNGHYEIVKLLLQNKKVRDKINSNTVRFYFTHKTLREIVKLLLLNDHVKEILSDEEINFYKNKLQELNESVRDLMKSKTNDEIIKKMRKDLTEQDLLNISCKNGFIYGVELALKNGFDPSINQNYAIKLASQNGHMEIVKLLLQNKKIRRKLTDYRINFYENQIKTNQ